MALLRNNVIDQLDNYLSNSYDIKQDVQIFDRTVPLLAEAKTNFQHYAINKKWVLDEFVVREILLIFYEDRSILLDEMNRYKEWMQQYIHKTVLSQTHHFRSRFIVLLFNMKNIENPDIKHFVAKSYQFYWLKWGFRGWYESFFVLFNLNNFSWILPKKGKEIEPLLQKLRECLQSV